MPLSPQDEAFLTEVTNRISDRSAIDPRESNPSDHLYEPFYENDDLDPIRLMAKRILRDNVGSFQSLSGYRGSGKTTELFRLRKLLADEGCQVIYADAGSYLSNAAPVDTGNFLLVLAGAFNDALVEKGFSDKLGESWWNRLKDVLGTEVTIPEIGVKAEAAGFGGNITLAFKENETFRKQVAEAVAHRLNDIKKAVDLFFEDGIKAIRSLHGEKVKTVFIFDSLEQITGSRLNQRVVMDSLIHLFTKNNDYLRVTGLHMVLTAPPWINFINPGFEVRVLATQKLWKKDTREKYEEGFLAITSLLKKRFGEPGFEKFFGPLDPDGTAPLANRVIKQSGGHFRDLLRIVEEALLLADELPVTPATIESAITSVRRNFLPLASDTVATLWEVHRTQRLDYVEKDKNSIPRVAEFLNSHIVLNFRNGDTWYDLHPLVVDEVREIMEETVIPASPGGTSGK